MMAYKNPPEVVFLIVKTWVKLFMNRGLKQNCKWLDAY